MQRLAAIILLTALSASSISLVGCSMCCGTDDLNYPTYGGVHQRADPAYGRVGSVFSDPFAHVGGPSADSNLEPYPEPRANQDFGDEDEDDLDLEREDEDLDDDLENLDRDDVDREDLERIDPLDDDELELKGARDKEDTTTASRTRWRRSR